MIWHLTDSIVYGSLSVGRLTWKLTCKAPNDKARKLGNLIMEYGTSHHMEMSAPTAKVDSPLNVYEHTIVYGEEAAMILLARRPNIRHTNEELRVLNALGVYGDWRQASSKKRSLMSEAPFVYPPIINIDIYILATMGVDT